MDCLFTTLVLVVKWDFIEITEWYGYLHHFLCCCAFKRQGLFFLAGNYSASQGFLSEKADKSWHLDFSEDCEMFKMTLKWRS